MTVYDKQKNPERRYRYQYNSFYQYEYIPKEMEVDRIMLNKENDHTLYEQDANNISLAFKNVGLEADKIRPVLLTRDGVSQTIFTKEPYPYKEF